ncbi:SCO family protein [Alkalihalobacillus trypoxylicola]|uniref:Transporter n=1 Tax=Alkalihalobacillus trypoxylicola TaxID=519424 RepID=A0A162EE88_9BACI|nr:SCO family protein [Alkalihalobacillus trypoxylicola]KYG32366.1 transporter [Alkalihalobacillus trypoxylicola]
MKKLIFITMVLFLSGCGWMYELGSSSSEGYEFEGSMPEFTFTDHNNEAFGTEQLEGQYYLANMIFTYCATVCPTMTPNMQRLQETLEGDGVELQFVSFTVDPVRDTPDHLKQYGSNVGANLETWHFLSGYEIEELAALSNEAFSAIVQEDKENDDIIHSTQFYLINKEGQVIRKYSGLQPNQEPIIEDIKRTIENEM